MQSTTRNSCNGTVVCVQGLFQTQGTNILAKTTQSFCRTQELISAMISCTSTLSHSVVPAEQTLRGSLMVNRLTVLYVVTSGQNMCSLFRSHQSGGRPNKQRKKCGGPSEGSSQSIANSILRNAPPSWKSVTPLSLSHFLPPITVSLHDLQCDVCGCIIDRPVETPCGKVACSVCLSALISNSDLMSFTYIPFLQ